MARLHGKIIYQDEHKHKVVLDVNDKAHKFASRFINAVKDAYSGDKFIHADFHQHDKDEITLIVSVHNAHRSMISFGIMKVPNSHAFCTYVVKLKSDFSLKDKKVECLFRSDDLPIGVDEANKKLTSMFPIHIKGY